MKSRHQLLAEAGVALFGARWQSALAAEVHITARHMRRLVAGYPIPPQILREVLALCRHRNALLANLTLELEDSCRDMASSDPAADGTGKQ